MLTSAVNLLLVKSDDMVAQMGTFGIPGHLIAPIGVIEAICSALYLIPRTAVLGAILMTAYLGGAVMKTDMGGKIGA